MNCLRHEASNSANSGHILVLKRILAVGVIRLCINLKRVCWWSIPLKKSNKFVYNKQ